MTALRQRMLEDLRIRNYAPTTVACYIRSVAEFAQHFNKPPDQLGPEEIRAWQLFLLKEKRVKRVIVNLEKVKYIDSAGVASLVEGLKLSRDLKSGFALYGLSKTTREVLELTRLLKVFEVYDNEEEALSAIPGGAGGAK